jgi:hypothetical protein
LNLPDVSGETLDMLRAAIAEVWADDVAAVLSMTVSAPHRWVVVDCLLADGSYRTPVVDLNPPGSMAVRPVATRNGSAGPSPTLKLVDGHTTPPPKEPQP